MRMKRIIVILLLLSLTLSSIGCSAVGENDETITENVTENTSDNDQDKTYPDETDVEINPPKGSGENFSYSSETSDKTDLLIEWIKSDGKLLVASKDYSKHDKNQEFISWAKGNGTILLPINKSSYLFRFVHVSGDKFYQIAYMSKDATDTIHISICPLTDEKRQKNIIELMEQYEISDIDQYKKSNVACQWGEYYYMDDIDNDTGENRNACFIHDGYFIHLRVSGKLPWDAKYFDYFDFENVPVK